MKIIHTSDWHLGRQFGPISLSTDQEAFADWLVDLVGEEQPDLVVIAGDIYDRAIAPTESIALFADTVTRLLDRGTVVAAITGNHDGAGRVASYDDLLDRSGFIIRGGYQGAGGVVRREFADGPLDLVLLPFLDPQAAPDEFGAEVAEPDGADDMVERRRRRTHQSVLESAVALARASLSAPRSLAIAHAFVTGGESSESERQLVVGGTGEVSASLFDGFSYTALGHLHRPQSVSGDVIRYSGTPLAYSFSENHDKSVVMIEMDASGSTSTSLVPVDRGRKVITITGEIADLLDGAKHPGASECFVRAVVTDRETVLDAKARLAQVYPHVVEVKLQPPVEGGGGDGPGDIDVTKLSAIDAARMFWDEAEGAPPDEAIDALLAEALRAASESVTS